MPFLLHLRHNWPLAAAIAVLLALLALALASGRLPTNQGGIERSNEPERYWRWVRRLAALAKYYEDGADGWRYEKVLG